MPIYGPDEYDALQSRTSTLEGTAVGLFVGGAIALGVGVGWAWLE
jgi:hypothetical protein